jgi:hypothetical protein
MVVKHQELVLLVESVGARRRHARAPWQASFAYRSPKEKRRRDTKGMGKA